MPACSRCIDSRIELQHLPKVPGELHLTRVEDGEVPHPRLAERLYMSLFVAAKVRIGVVNALSFPAVHGHHVAQRQLGRPEIDEYREATRGNVSYQLQRNLPCRFVLCLLE